MDWEPFQKLKFLLLADTCFIHALPHAAGKGNAPARDRVNGWGALYSTTSYPFDAPKTSKIAVKVINHYGDEVLKVYEVK